MSIMTQVTEKVFDEMLVTLDGFIDMDKDDLPNTDTQLISFYIYDKRIGQRTIVKENSVYHIDYNHFQRVLPILQRQEAKRIADELIGE